MVCLFEKHPTDFSRAMADSSFLVFLLRDSMSDQELELGDNPHRQAHNSGRLEEEKGHKTSLASAPLEPVGVSTTRSLRAMAAERAFDT